MASAMAGTSRSGRLGERGQFEETVGGGPRMVPKGLAAAGFLEGSLDLRTAGSAVEPGTRGCREEARGRGGQAGRLAKGRVGWQAEAPSRGTPRNVEAVSVQGSGSLGRGAPTLLLASAASLRAGGVVSRLPAPPGVARQPTPALPSAPLGSARW